MPVVEKSLTNQTLRDVGRGCCATAYQHSITTKKLKKEKKSLLLLQVLIWAVMGWGAGKVLKPFFGGQAFPLLLISHHSVIFALAFREHRRAFIPPEQPVSSAFCLPARVFWRFDFEIPVPWIPETTILGTLLLILEARLLMLAVGCSWPMIFCCKGHLAVIRYENPLSFSQREAGTQEARSALPGGNVSSG